MKTASLYTCDNCPKILESEKNYRMIISKISHEIRNPLTLIYSTLQLLELEYPAVTDSQLWVQLKKDIQDTIHLLKDISTWNRDSSASQTAFSVSVLLSEIAASFRALSQEKQITFITDFENIADNLILRGDKQALKEALLNLLINAADAVSHKSPTQNSDGTIHKNPTQNSAETIQGKLTQGSAGTIQEKLTQDSAGTIQENPGQIAFTALMHEDSLCIHVHDNGPGIPEEYLPTLFDPFVTHKKQGTGLGLSIAQNAVQKYSGTLTVETNTSDSDTYTDFCIRLPL